MDALIGIAAVTALVISAVGWGLLTFRLMRVASSVPVHDALVVGFGALGTVLLTVGFLSFSLPSIGLTLAIGAGGLFWYRRALCDVRWLVPSLPASVIVMLIALSGFAAPAGDTRNDAIRYHLLEARAWLMQGFIAPLDHESHTAFPALVETLFAAGMSGGSDLAPGLLGAAFFLLLLSEVRATASALNLPDRARDAAQVFTAFMPLATNHVEQGFVDVPFSVFVLAALRFGSFPLPRFGPAVSGLCFGFACGTKYTGLLAFANFIALIGAHSVVRRGSLRPILTLCAFALVGVPCYIRNIFAFHTPIFPPPPFLSSMLPIQGMTSTEIEAFHAAILSRGGGLGVELPDFLLLPLRITFSPAWFHGAGGIGLIPLAFAPIGIGLLLRSEPARILTGWFMLSVFTWFLTQQELRFFLPMACLLSTFAGLGAHAMLTEQRLVPRAVAGAAVAVSLAYTGTWTVQQRLERIESIVSAETGQLRWRREVRHAGAIDYVNDEPSVKSVLVLRSSVPAFYLRKQFRIWSPILAAPETEAHSFGATHVLDSMLGGWVLTSPPPNWKLEFEDSGARIYRVSALKRDSLK